jgi:hypothetical protein
MFWRLDGAGSASGSRTHTPISLDTEMYRSPIQGRHTTRRVCKFFAIEGHGHDNSADIFIWPVIDSDGRIGQLP